MPDSWIMYFYLFHSYHLIAMEMSQEQLQKLQRRKCKYHFKAVQEQIDIMDILEESWARYYEVESCKGLHQFEIYSERKIILKVVIPMRYIDSTFDTNDLFSCSQNRLIWMLSRRRWWIWMHVLIYWICTSWFNFSYRPGSVAINHLSFVW